MIEILEKCLCLFFSLMILGQAYVVRRAVGTWIFPACLFGLFWFGYTFIPLAALFSVPAEPTAVAFILLCSLAFSASSLPFNWRTAFRVNENKCEADGLVFSSNFLKGVFVLVTIASVVFLALNLVIQGITLSDTLNNPYGVVAVYAERLYSETLTDNIFERMTVPCAYVGSSLGGFLYAGSGTKSGRQLIVAMAFLPAVLVALTQSGKGLLFLSLVFFYAALLVRRASENRLRLLTPGMAKASLFYGPVLAAVVTLAFVSRAGLYSLDDNEVLAARLGTYLASYAFGHLYAFSDWFTSVLDSASVHFGYPSESATFGFYTFTGLFKLLGSEKIVQMGLYDDYLYEGLLVTNVYTMFRGLIVDFGLVGSLVFMFVTGLLFHQSFQAMLINRRPIFSVAVFIFMMGYFYMSFIVSALGWTRFLVAFFLLWSVLTVNKALNESSGRPARSRSVTA